MCSPRVREFFAALLLARKHSTLPSAQIVNGMMEYFHNPDCIEPQNLTRRESFKKIYAKRKEAGLCVRCGKAQPIEGQTLCQKCLKEVRQREKKTTEDRVSQGLGDS